MFCGEIRPEVSAVGVGGRAEVVGERDLIHHDDVAFAAVVFGHDVDEVVIECLLVGEVTIAAIAVDQLGVCGFHVLFEHSLVGKVLGADAAAGLEEPFQPGGCLGKFGQWVLLPGVGGSGTSGEVSGCGQMEMGVNWGIIPLSHPGQEGECMFRGGGGEVLCRWMVLKTCGRMISGVPNPNPRTAAARHPRYACGDLRPARNGN